MAQTTKTAKKESVVDKINALDEGLRKPVAYLRELILDTSSNIGEQVKWNSPGFYYTGEMKEFNPKEYKRDIVVINLHRGRIMLVFPTGAKIDDRWKILEGNYTDGRRMITFRDEDDIKSKKDALQGVIRDWLEKVDEEV